MQGNVRVGNRRIEIIDRHLFQYYAALYSGNRLGEKVCLAVDAAVSAAEDGRIKMKRRGIDLVRQVDIADIVCLEIQVTQDERSLRVPADIGDAGVVDFYHVYLERVDIFHRLLPAAFLERDLAGRFTAQLQQVDIEFRLVQPEFGHELL